MADEEAQEPTPEPIAPPPAPVYRRVRNTGKIRFTKGDEFIWNRVVNTPEGPMVPGTPVDQTKISGKRLRSLFEINYIVSANHPHLAKPE